MLEENQKKYIHVYMDMESETVYFHSTSTPYRLGEKLLDFVYADLERVFASTEALRELHPYFSTWTPEALKLLQVTVDSQEKKLLTLKKIQQLQAEYTFLLGAFAYGAEENHPEAGQYLLKHPLDTRGTLQNTTLHGKNHWLMDYFIMGFEDCLMCEFIEMLRRHQMIKICKNCGRYFIPKRGNKEYCTRRYTDTGKTCADVGYTKTFEKSVKKDELLQAYTRAYKTHYARMTKPRKKAANMTREEFENWYKQAKKGLELARQGEIDEEDYKMWLKK